MMNNQKYCMTYEMSTAKGDKVVHQYTGVKENIIQAIQIANAHRYRIISIDRV